MTYAKKLLAHTLAITLVLLGVGANVFLPLARAATPTVVITSPREGETIVNTNIQITGTAPPNELVQIKIVDTDTNLPAIEHQSTPQLAGSVTTDTNGEWVFVPQQQLVPGQFSVQASHVSSDGSGQVHSSAVVKFVAVDATGSRGWLSKLIKRRILIAAGLFVLLLVWVYLAFVRKKRRQGSAVQSQATSTAEEEAAKPAVEEVSSLFAKTPEGKKYLEAQSEKLAVLDEEADKIQQDLAKAAEQLEATNEEVEQFRKDILKSKERNSKPRSKARGEEAKE